MGPRFGALLAVAAVLAAALAGCANIPTESTPQAIGDLSAPSAGAPPLIDPKADPYTVVRSFVGAADNPDVAKGYLTEAAKPNWQGDAPPTIIAETFGTAPVPPQRRKEQGEGGDGNDFTVVLSVTKFGRLGAERAFVPEIGKPEFEVVLHRQNADAPWRIQTPPPTPLITVSKFTSAYQRVSVFFFDRERRVTVPDLRYIARRPLSGGADRVLRLLLDGPSETLNNAVTTVLPPETEMRFNAVPDADGAVLVNLTKLGDRSLEDRQLIAAQIVLSLRDVVQTKIKLQADGQPLIRERSEWRPSDIPAYDLPTRPSPELLGMYTGTNNRVYSLKDGSPIAGPAGSGELKVVSAAQSIDGKTLAVVQEVPTGVRLRVGGLGAALKDVDLTAPTLTRPTWSLPAPGGTSNELWTVQNGVEVVRVVRTGNDSWAPSPVIATDLRGFGGSITDLRLSRDGVRAAIVVGGRLVVASVVRTKDSVSIRSPREIRPGELTTVVGADWYTQDTLVVATGQSSQPAVNVLVDGFELSPYNSANLAAPITAIAAAPDRSVLVTDNRGIWDSSEIRQIWHLHSEVPGARPFYPG
jgi:hypothetical protein